jgi:hypothetical protein
MEEAYNFSRRLENKYRTDLLSHFVCPCGSPTGKIQLKYGSKIAKHVKLCKGIEFGWEDFRTVPFTILDVARIERRRRNMRIESNTANQNDLRIRAAEDAEESLIEVNESTIAETDELQIPEEFDNASYAKYRPKLDKLQLKDLFPENYYC